ncbi:MAG: DUF547 domain-containing protein [Polyangiales bacterium]
MTTPPPHPLDRFATMLARSGALLLGGLSPVAACQHTEPPRRRLSTAEVRGATGFPYAAYGALLAAYVDGDGRVDYAGLRRDRGRLDRVLAYVVQVGPSARPDLYPTDDARKAFFLTAYNANVWRGVVDRPPLRTLDGVRVSFFYATRFVVDGAETNLRDLENDRVRAAFRDARVHFALNCASLGCPRLPREPFTPERLDAQLDREARRFCNEPRNVRVDAVRRRVVLSKIFDWYADDFAGGAVAFINRYRDRDAQVPGGWAVEFADYDWRLNGRP